MHADEEHTQSADKRLYEKGCSRRALTTSGQGHDHGFVDGARGERERHLDVFHCRWARLRRAARRARGGRGRLGCAADAHGARRMIFESCFGLIHVRLYSSRIPVESARVRSRPLKSIHRRQKKLPTRFRNIHSRCQLDFCLPPRLVAPVAVCALGVALRPPHALPTLSPSFYSRSTRAIDTHPPARHPIGAQTLRGARSPRRSAL